MQRLIIPLLLTTVLICSSCQYTPKTAPILTLQNKTLLEASSSRIPDWVLAEQSVQPFTNGLALVLFIDRQPLLSSGLTRLKQTIRSNLNLELSTKLGSSTTNRDLFLKFSLQLQTNTVNRQLHWQQTALYWEKWWFATEKRAFYTIYLKVSVLKSDLQIYLTNAATATGVALEDLFNCIWNPVTNQAGSR